MEGVFYLDLATDSFISQSNPAVCVWKKEVRVGQEVCGIKWAGDTAKSGHVCVSTYITIHHRG